MYVAVYNIITHSTVIKYTYVHTCKNACIEKKKTFVFYNIIQR